MRGWGPEAFERAKPGFKAALRWGLYAEKVAPILASWREVQAMTVDTTMPNLREVLAEKQKAEQAIPVLEGLLYPEDTDG